MTKKKKIDNDYFVGREIMWQLMKETRAFENDPQTKLHLAPVLGRQLREWSKAMLENRLMDLCNSIYGGTPDDIALNLELLIREVDGDFDLDKIVDLLPTYIQRAKNNVSK